MAKVRFTDVDEFLAELRIDQDHIVRGIVRVTNRWKRADSLPLMSLTVVASFQTSDAVVLLESGCGSFMPGLGEEEQTRAVATKRREQIEALVKELGHEVRAGVFE